LKGIYVSGASALEKSCYLLKRMEQKKQFKYVFKVILYNVASKEIFKSFPQKREFRKTKGLDSCLRRNDDYFIRQYIKMIRLF